MILIANHQSEADPAVFALLLEKTFPKLAQGALVSVLLRGWLRSAVPAVMSACACSVTTAGVPGFATPPCLPACMPACASCLARNSLSSP